MTAYKDACLKATVGMFGAWNRASATAALEDYRRAVALAPSVVARRKATRRLAHAEETVESIPVVCVICKSTTIDHRSPPHKDY